MHSTGCSRASGNLRGSFVWRTQRTWLSTRGTVEARGALPCEAGPSPRHPPLDPQTHSGSPSQAGSQSDRNTQFGFFVSGTRSPKQWGDLSTQGKHWPNSNAADHRLFGRRVKPRLGKYGAAAAADSPPTRIRTTAQKLCVGCITIRPPVV